MALPKPGDGVLSVAEYQAKYVGGGSSILEAPTVTTPDGVAWGSTNTPSTKRVQLEAPSGKRSFAHLAFSGDTSAYKFTEIKGASLDVAVSSATDTQVSLGVGTAATTSVKLIPIYVDGSEKSLAVTVTDHNGDTLSTLALTATVGDPFLGAAALTDLIAVYSAKDTASGDLADAAVAMQDVSGNSEPDLSVVTTSTGNLAAQSSGFSNQFLASEIILKTHGTTNMAILDSALSATVASGWIIIKTDAKLSWKGMLSLGGYSGSTVQAGEWVIFQDTGVYGYNVAGGSGKATVSHSGDDTYHFLEFWQDGANYHFAASTVSGTYHDLGTNSSTTAPTLRDGLKLGYYGTDTITDLHVAAIGLYSSNQQAGFEAIYDAIT